MKPIMPLTKLTILLLTLLVVLAGCALASKHKSGRGKGEGRLGAKGPEVVNNGQRYVLLLQVRAVKSRGPSSDPEQQLAGMGLSSEAVIGSKGNMILFRRKAIAGQGQGTLAAQTDSSGKRTYPVLQNQSTGNLAIVLGTVQVKLSDPGQAPALARQHGLSVRRIYLNLGFAILQAPPGRDPFAAANALVTQPGVESVTVELLENVNVPH